MKGLFGILFVGVAVVVAGCSPNTLYFSEGTSLGFRAEFKPDASEPVNSSLAYKRRIVAVVPPQQPDSASWGDWFTGRQNIQQGEAISLVSTFTVDATATQGLTIENNFVTGTAARKATDRDAVGTVKAIMMAPASLNPLAQDTKDRQKKLNSQLAAMDEAHASKVLTALKQQPHPLWSAKDTLSEDILEANDSTILDLEKAFNTP